jgi:hypothetical protein
VQIIDQDRHAARHRLDAGALAESELQVLNPGGHLVCRADDTAVTVAVTIEMPAPDTPSSRAQSWQICRDRSAPTAGPSASMSVQRSRLTTAGPLKAESLSVAPQLRAQ